MFKSTRMPAFAVIGGAPAGMVAGGQNSMRPVPTVMRNHGCGLGAGVGWRAAAAAWVRGGGIWTAQPDSTAPRATTAGRRREGREWCDAIEGSARV